MRFASVFSRNCPSPKRGVSARTSRPANLSCLARCTLILGATALLPGALRAQSQGSLDTGFLSALTQATAFTVTAEYVTTKDVTTEKIAAAGDSGALNVLDSTGAFISPFTFPDFGGLNRLIYTMVPEKVPLNATGEHALLIGGLFGKDFTGNNKNKATNIVRIDLEGDLDVTFDTGSGADDLVTSILPLADRSMMVGGQFTQFNKQPYSRLVYLTSTGAIDPTFAPLAVGDSVFALAEQIDPATGAPNGQILVAGDFSAIGSAGYTKLARVDLHGNIDSTFKPLIDQRVLALAVQPDGKIVIGGQFTTVNGQSVGHLARLNTDGSLDPTFNASASIVPTGINTPVAVYTLKLLPDGRIYVGGNFSAVDGVTRQFLARIETDGRLDTAFDPVANVSNSVQSVAVQADGKVLVAETVSKKIDNIFPASLIRLVGDSEIVSTISLEAAKPNAQEGTHDTRKVGVFTLRRVGGDTAVPLSVYFSISGSAQSRVAYKPLAISHYSDSIGQITFPANVNKVKVKVKPLDNILSDAPETVVLTLLPSQNGSGLYDTAAPVASTVEIRNAP